MADEIENDMTLLLAYDIELKKINTKRKELLQKKKEIEANICAFLQSKNKDGIRLGEFVVLAKSKTKTLNKTKVDKTLDAKVVLENAGIKEPLKVLNDLMKAMKGNSISIPSIKLEKNKYNSSQMVN